MAGADRCVWRHAQQCGAAPARRGRSHPAGQRGERVDAVALAVLRRRAGRAAGATRQRGRCRRHRGRRSSREPLSESRVSMIKSTLTISNKLGLHARASAKLTKLAGSFKSEVFMSRNGRRVNAKSIMGVMMLAAGVGSLVELETEGPDEQAAQDAITALVNDKFGEGQ